SVAYNVSFDCDNSDGVVLELAEGLPSGSEFPIGVTTVIYNIEFEGEVIDSCEFSVTVVDDLIATQNFEQETFSVYPNPAADVLNISASKTINTIQVFDLAGKKILNQSPNNTAT